MWPWDNGTLPWPLGFRMCLLNTLLLCSLVVIMLLSLFSAQGVLWQQKTRHDERKWSYHCIREEISLQAWSEEVVLSPVLERRCSSRHGER